MRQKQRDHLDTIYRYILVNKIETHYLHEYVAKNKNAADLLYDKFLDGNDAEELYPAYGGVIANIQSQLSLYGLSKDFYPSLNSSWMAYHNLIASNKYKTIQVKIQREILDK